MKPYLYFCVAIALLSCLQHRCKCFLTVNSHECKESSKIVKAINEVQQWGGDIVFDPAITSMVLCLEHCCKTADCFVAQYRNGQCHVAYLWWNDSAHRFYKNNIARLVRNKGRYIRSVNVTSVIEQNNSLADSGGKTNIVPIKSMSNHTKPCEVGLVPCGKNELCQPFNSRRRSGICVCVTGASYNSEGVCIINVNLNQTKPTSWMPFVLPLQEATAPSLLNVPVVSMNSTLYGMPTEKTTLSTIASTSTTSTTAPVPPKKIKVEIKNETLTLQRGSTMYQSWFNISAFAKGDPNVTYVYKWTIIEKPPTDDSGSMKDGQLQTVALTNLVAGVYKLQVEVTGPNAHGQALGNITVHPANHRNKPPVAVIVPTNLVVNLPNNGVILDGSGSTDEAPMKSFHWELTMAPMKYKLQDENSKTLQLNDLIAGNYTIMLIVEDEHGVKASTTASVYVVKETDYPPIANAGGDKITYLPISSVVLNGNMSSDDHGIKEWEWTKGPEDSGNAVDMQDTRTSHLQLSNLESGHYHFILKITDASGQSSNSSAHVYVHNSADNTPTAIAGENITLVIPNTSTTLDGSKSTGTTTQSHYLWKQISGSTAIVLATPTMVRTNISALTRGVYTFGLTVWNANDTNKSSTSNLTINVIQDINAAPVARAGEDFEVILPSSAVVINGTKSSDDVAVVRWLWKRDAKSLAAANIVKGSDRSPVLIFTGAVAGLYVWNLTIWDDQGSSDSDTVSVIVKNGIHRLDEVEVRIGLGIEFFTMGQRDSLLQKLQLFLHSATSDVEFFIQDIRGFPLSGEVSLIIIGKRDKKMIAGHVLANELRTSAMNPTDAQILDLPIISIDTVVCQNNCSGHGHCIEASRECRCNSWWMQSSMRKHFADRVSNCDWSVIYVFVVTVGLSLLLGLGVWVSVVVIVKKFRIVKQKRPRHTRYSLLDNQEEAIKLRARPPRDILDSTSSDSDSEALFDARKSRSREKRSNGHLKLQRGRT